MGMGSSISGIGASLPVDPATKAAIMGAGALFDLIDNNNDLPEVNQNYMTKPGRRLIMEMGGEIPAYVEKDEVVRSPNGKIQRVGGGTHDSGNDTLLIADENTDVYSNQISIKGKTMADHEEERHERSEERKKRILKLTQKLSKQPDNLFVKNGAVREIKRLTAEELEDRMERETHMAVQELLNDSEAAKEMAMGGTTRRRRLGCGGRIKKMAMGGVPKSVIDRINQMVDLDPEGSRLMAEQYGLSQLEDGTYGYNPPGMTSYKNAVEIPTQQYRKIEQPEVPAPLTTDDQLSTGTPPGTGGGGGKTDMYKTGVNIQGYTNAAALIGNMLERKPIRDYSVGYGDRGLDTNTKTLGVAAVNRDASEADIVRGGASALNTVRNQARGASQFLANALAVESSMQDKMSQVGSNYVTQEAGILDKRAGLYDKQDQVKMQGQKTQFDEEEQATDNFWTQAAIAGKDIGLTEQQKAMYDKIKTTNDPETFRTLLNNLLLGSEKKKK